MSSVLRLLNLKPQEVAPARLLALYYFLLTATYVLGTSATPSIFYSRVPDAATYYPLLMTLNTLISAPLVVVFNRLARWMSLTVLVPASYIFLALVMVGLEIALRLGWAWASALMFVMTVSSLTIGMVQYYLIASNIFDARQSKRILGLIGIGGGVAGIMSGLAIRPFIALLSRLLGPEFGAESIVLLMVVLIFITAFVAQRTRPYFRVGTDEVNDTAHPPEKVVYDRYLIAIMVIIGAFILAATVIDYQFQTVSAAYFAGDEAGLTAFKGTYSAAAGGIQMAMRLFIVGPLLVHLGLLVGLLALPVTIIGMTGAFLSTGSLWSATLMKGGDQSVRFTLNEVVMELAWLPIPARQRLAAKPFVNGTFVSIVQGVTGVGLFALQQVEVGSVRLLSMGVLAVVAVWIPAAFVLRRGYVSRLMASIQSHKLDFEDLQINIADGATVRTIDQMLMHSDDVQRIFILDMLHDAADVTPWAARLRTLYETSDNTLLKAQIILLAAAHPDIVPDAELMRHIEANDDLADESILAAAERNLTDLLPVLSQKLKDYRLEVQVASARALLLWRGLEAQDAMLAVRRMVSSKDAERIAAGLAALRGLPSELVLQVVPPTVLRGLLGNKSEVVQVRVLALIADTQAPLLGDVVVALGEPATFAQARAALESYARGDVVVALLSAYANEETAWAVRVGAVRALVDYPTAEGAKILVDTLSNRSRVLYNEAVEALLVHARSGLLSEAQLATLEGEGLVLARTMYHLAIGLVRLREVDDEPLMRDLLQTDFNEALPTLLRLSVMDVPQTDVESVIVRLLERDAETMGNVLEILDNVLSNDERALIIPLFEDNSADELARIAGRHFDDLDTTLESELINYINSGDDWQAAVSLNYIMRHPQLNIHIGRHGKSLSQRSRDLVARRGTAGKAKTLMHVSDGQETLMYSMLEKTMLLKETSLFADVSTRDLYYLAQVSETANLKAGKTLFCEGDEANMMYIIGAGQVRIHLADGTEVALLEQGDAMGEVALLDAQPRTASATTVTDVKLLTIHADDFFRTVAVQPEINRAIMRMLAGRVRGLLQLKHEHQIAVGFRDVDD